MESKYAQIVEKLKEKLSCENFRIYVEKKICKYFDFLESLEGENFQFLSMPTDYEIEIAISGNSAIFREGKCGHEKVKPCDFVSTRGKVLVANCSGMRECKDYKLLETECSENSI